MILKPSVSVILYLPLNCAKHNITRRKPNITAQQYNLPQANITEKTTCRYKSFFQVGMTGYGCFAPCLLVDPIPSGFGTRLHTFLLQNNPPDCFVLRKNPLRLQIPFILCTKKDLLMRCTVKDSKRS